MNTAQRARAVEETRLKYRGKPFVWGSEDCLHLARTVLIKVGATGIPRLPNYSNEMQAIRQLKKQGHSSLESLLSDYCIEIPPALATPSDLGVITGEGSLSAIGVCAGGKWLGWPADYPTFAVVSMKPDRVFRYV
jgi:hypothetical protein